MDVCVTCSCTRGLGMVCERNMCEEAFNCDGELVSVEGECCPQCIPRQVEECALTDEMVTIEIDGCVSVYEVSKTTCGGTCESSSSAAMQDSSVDSSCKCCKPETTSTQYINLLCPDNTYISHEYVQIDSCACNECKEDEGTK